MNCSKMDSILSIYHSKEEKRKLTKDEQNSYINEIKMNLAQYEFDDSLIHYIIAGPTNLGIRGYMDWYQNASDVKQVETMEKLLRNRSMLNLSVVKRLRMLLFMLSAAITSKDVNVSVIGHLLAGIVDSSYMKEGCIINDFEKIFKKYFLDMFRLDAVIPPISAYGFSSEYEIKICLFFEEAFSMIHVEEPEDKEKLEILKNCLLPIEKSSKPNEEPQNIKEKEKSQQTADAIKEPSKENAKATGKKSKKDAQVSLNGTTAIKLFELAQVVDVMESAAKALAQESKDKDKTISSLQGQVNDLNEKIYHLETENANLRSEVLDRQKEIELLSNEKTEMSARIERQSSVLDVFQEDKANSQTEQLNSLAASLVRLYKEFQLAKSMDLTTDLEMILLDLVEDIFKKLEKNGVDVKGRL